jgi:rubrerythrin
MMWSVALPSSPALAALAEDLERERRLIRAYRMHLPDAGSPRVRRLFERGLEIKRRHEAELDRLLSAHGGAPVAEGPVDSSGPGPREVLTWHAEQERLLALRYRDHLRLAADPDVRLVLERCAADQAEYAALLKSVYRDFSAA